MIETPGDEKRGWRRAADIPAPDVDTAQRLLEPWLRGRRIAAVDLMAGGLMNRNCRVRIDGAPDVVLRLFDRADDAAAAKEMALLARLDGRLPVPRLLYAEPRRRGGDPPFAVMSLVDGVALAELKQSGDVVAIGDAAYDAGCLLAQLQAIRFPQPGLLTPSLDVDSSLLPEPLTTAALVEMFARSQTFTRRAGSRLTADIVAVAREWDEHPTAPALPTTLVHGDFNARNVFVARRVGRWRVTAILDWEFAFAGPAYCDIGNFLRYERPARPRFEPSFSRGLRDGGLTLDGDWLRAARIADLPALCELLTREAMPEDVAAEIVGLLSDTVSAARG